VHVTRIARDERGVTLAEVLVTIALLGIIMVPLSNAIIGYMRNSDAVSQRLATSHDIQLSASYLSQDVQSVGVRDWTVHPYALKQSIEAANPSLIPAGSGLFQCGGYDAVLRLAWDNPLDVATTVRVVYGITTVGGEKQLRRVQCVGAGAPVEVVVAHKLSSTNPSVTCSSTCTAATVPQKVTLTLSLLDPAGASSPLVVTLEGQRRQS
jgi:prepilin-type N-terminal cleavage/methylation domain-containing protein